ncbi:type I-F CRISPR-associated protein Csy1 [Dokdonella ginsengisoli]|uniref:Type I-F CRISPR-associated protein Csy1 n=1 Tax=Dokdonella ginsengisoli TaxID=363846 RepID=A0ABV9QRC7_9GAMM
MPELTDRGKDFRAAIAGFIQARREAKLKSKDEDADTASKYDYDTWLADAARRVGQIQAVTHVLKATHPDARGSSLHVRPDTLPRHAEIGSHVLGADFAEDVVGNAAALDVYKLLKLEVDGRRLLDWMQDGDTDLRSALHADSTLAADWMAAFGGLVRTDAALGSHEAAKQVYWLAEGEPTDDAGYHLLQPMFSSSLAQAAHAEIQEARFGEENKIARQAFRGRDAHESAYRDYRNLVARKLGGTKPQNISQLNSERGGINYLLASLPPSWDVEHPQKLLRIGSAMERLTWFKGVRGNVRRLAEFLLGDPPANDRTRETRRRIEQELGTQLALYAAETWARFEPGWTRDEQCTLPLHQKIWLDPGRTEEIAQDPLDPAHSDDDRDFHAAFVFGNWPDQVAGDFANWVNERLREAGLTNVGDAEYGHWAKQAIVEAAWPVPVQRRAPKGGQA